MQPRNLMLTALASGVLLGTALGAASKPVMKQAPEPAWRAMFQTAYDTAGAYAYPEATAPQDLTPPSGFQLHAPVFAWELREALPDYTSPRLARFDPLPLPQYVYEPVRLERFEPEDETARTGADRAEPEREVAVDYGVVDAAPDEARDAAVAVPADAAEAPLTEVAAVL